MTNTTNLAQRTQKTKETQTNPTKLRRKKIITPFEASEYLFTFLANKICLFSALSPFGLAYFSATFPMHETSLSTLFAFCGILLAGFGVTSLKYIGALSLYLIFMLISNKDITDKKWISGLAATLSLFIVGFAFILMDGFLLYDFLLLTLECILCFVSFFAFNTSAVLIRTIKSRQVIDQTELLSITVFFSVLLLSIKSVPNIEAVATILAVSTLLIIAYTQGFNFAAISGLIIGTVMSINSPLPAQIICTYTVSSLCAGILKPYGKIAVCFGFIGANAIMMIYMNSSLVTLIDIVCILSSALILLLLPKTLTEKLNMLFNASVCAVSQKDDSISEVISEHLSSVSDSFIELSDIFNSITEKTSKTGELSPGAVFDETINTVCQNCNLISYCWHKNVEETVNMALSLYEEITVHGRLTEFDIPSEFRSYCIHFDDFLENLNKNYEMQKINISWASKVFESRMLISEQYKDFSSVIDNIKNNLSSQIVCDKPSELKIKSALDKKGISPSSLRVTLKDCCYVQLKLPICDDIKTMIKVTETIIGAQMGFPFYLSDVCKGVTEYKLTFCEKAAFSVETGFAQTADVKTAVCGDSYLFSTLPDGKYALCLSDGMGRGEDALNQSKTTVTLIKKLLSLGFPKETALKIINTFLIFKSQKEVFATADICVVNLHSGALEFIKSGAVSSYIKSGTEIKKISCSSLPAGSISALKCDLELSYAKDGDFIIMITDGVSDILETQSENILKNIIRSYNGTSPQILADIIIKKAMQMKNDDFSDDMTVLVSKVTEEL